MMSENLTNLFKQLVAKAEGTPPHPGLIAKKITDKRGYTSTHWVKTETSQPSLFLQTPAQHPEDQRRDNHMWMDKHYKKFSSDLHNSYGKDAVQQAGSQLHDVNDFLKNGGSSYNDDGEFDEDSDPYGYDGHASELSYRVNQAPPTKQPVTLHRGANGFEASELKRLHDSGHLVGRSLSHGAFESLNLDTGPAERAKSPVQLHYNVPEGQKMFPMSHFTAGQGHLLLDQYEPQEVTHAEHKDGVLHVNVNVGKKKVAKAVAAPHVAPPAVTAPNTSPPRAGLHALKVTDKLGRTITHWVSDKEVNKVLGKTAKQAPAPNAKSNAALGVKPPTAKVAVHDSSVPKPKEYKPNPGEDHKAFITRMVGEHKAHLDHIKDEYGAHTLMNHAVITMGLPGSGKSHYLNNHHMKHGQYLHVDVDALKKLHPDYDPKAPEKVHGFSKELEGHLFNEASKAGVPLMLDTTGGNHKKWAERIGHLRNHGYHHVGLSYTRVSPETSRKRNAARERSVPDEVIQGTLNEFQPEHPDNDGKTPFQHLSKLVDKVHVVDHEDEQAKHERAASGWKNYLNSERMSRQTAQTFGKAVSLAQMALNMVQLGTAKGA